MAQADGWLSMAKKDEAKKPALEIGRRMLFIVVGAPYQVRMSTLQAISPSGKYGWFFDGDLPSLHDVGWVALESVELLEYIGDGGEACKTLIPRLREIAPQPQQPVQAASV